MKSSGKSRADLWAFLCKWGDSNCVRVSSRGSSLPTHLRLLELSAALLQNLDLQISKQNWKQNPTKLRIGFSFRYQNDSLALTWLISKHLHNAKLERRMKITTKCVRGYNFLNPLFKSRALFAVFSLFCYDFGCHQNHKQFKKIFW